MLAAVETNQTPVITRPLLVSCRVVIKMADGSKGEHKGMYPSLEDALDRAIELFPEGEVVAFARAFGRRKAAR
jgi:hypothetical protein